MPEKYREIFCSLASLDIDDCDILLLTRTENDEVEELYSRIQDLQSATKAFNRTVILFQTNELHLLESSINNLSPIAC